MSYNKTVISMVYDKKKEVLIYHSLPFNEYLLKSMLLIN